MSYTITAEQWKTIERLEFAARIVATGLPPEYTTTPAGSLMDLALKVGDWMLFLQPNPEPTT